MANAAPAAAVNVVNAASAMTAGVTAGVTAGEMLAAKAVASAPNALSARPVKRRFVPKASTRTAVKSVVAAKATATKVVLKAEAKTAAEEGPNASRASPTPCLWQLPPMKP
jgi:hypothetical protein